MQVDPRHIHNTKINVPPASCKQCATPQKRRGQVSRTTPSDETCLAQTHFRKTETTRNHPHQNVLVTRMQVKTLYKQQNFSYINQYSNQPGPAEYNSGLRLERFGTFPVLAHGTCRIRLSEGISRYRQLKKKSAAIYLSTVHISAHTQMT
jgi:hypothetical protein